MQPVQVVQHEPGAEAGRSPILEVAVDAGGFFAEAVAALVELAVVAQVVDADFEAVARELGAQFRRNDVLAFRNEVEGGAEAEAFFQLHELAASGEAHGAFDVVRDDEREAFAAGPARPVGRGRLRPGQDRPDVFDTAALSGGEPTANGEAERPRQERLNLVVEFVAQHG
ncbi:hypothetical protein SBV1_3130016 [Verrucomicrobia bacterium]|nr:hypothetical protein SBV1_3130016 [Verrucomicrobiota bacterium]